MFDSAPKVSVVIPCYNLGAYLDQAVQSVLDQSYNDFEIIIIDDGSTDPATRHLFTSYQRPRTRIIPTKNQGLANTRNLGIREAKGLYICCLDADDILEPNFLERTVNVLESDQNLAFASCWLTAFGDAQFTWNPTSCDFPHLLAEDTVCTAALIRKEAILEVGGFDSHMPLSGYEDWDLAISLVERGLNGIIIPEYLFRYRIRQGSMSNTCTHPDNHALLMRYLIEKHSTSYKRHLPGILEIIEKRIIQLEKYSRSELKLEKYYNKHHYKILDNLLFSIPQPLNWRLPNPLRQWYSLKKLFNHRLIRSRIQPPRFSVVITGLNTGNQLQSAIERIIYQIDPNDEILIVNNNSKDPITSQILDRFKKTNIEIVKTGDMGSTHAREIGLRRSRAPIIFAMDSDQIIEPSYFNKAIKILHENSDISFVICGTHDSKTGFNWIPESAELHSILACPRINFPILRRESYFHVGGYDISLNIVMQADWELIIRLLEHGHKGILIPEPFINSHLPNDMKKLDHNNQLFTQHSVQTVVKKHLESFKMYWKESILGQENNRRLLQAHVDEGNSSMKSSKPLSPLNWGNLRRVEPVSIVWGLDRGQPIDRFYIDLFLNQHKQDIRGRVLEVKDPGYTKAYGQGVEKIDIVDISSDNPLATVYCDLANKGSLPENTYDCFILTQTIHIIYDIHQVIDNVAKTLRPGGVVLATLPCVSRIDYESGIHGDFWRFTTASARKLFKEAFGPGNVKIQAFGNVLTCCAFLMGISAGELTQEELNYHDPYFPLLVCVRAVKSQTNRISPSPLKPSENQKAIILMYHRVDQVVNDRWNLCVSPENFVEHLRFLRKSFVPVSLSELASQIQEGKIIDRAVVITFDDGYRDNLTMALPILNEFDFPVTFFISGDGAVYGKTFWWETLDASAQLMNLDEKTILDLRNRLMFASIDEREKILGSLHPPKNNLPARMTITDLKKLSQDKLVEVAAHGWSHRALSALPIDEQRREVIENIKMINEITSKEVTSFAYPFGSYFKYETKNILREAGIRVACTLDTKPITIKSDLFALPRLEVNNWDFGEFKIKIRSLFDE